MIKNVKKKADMQVRDKILTLLDSWQEAFGGPGGKHPHYYWAYAELKRAGVEFPKRSPDAAPIFTPPVTHPASLPLYLQAGYGMPGNSSMMLDEAMSSNGASLSMSDLERMLGAVELLTEMLRAANPNDHDAVNDEIITELVNQCRTDQKRIMSLVSSVRDEEFLGQALDLNDKLQTLLEKHDAIASGSPVPAEVTDVGSELPASTTPNLGAKVAPRAAVGAIVPINVLNDEEEEDEDDEFSVLARRKSKFRSTNAERASSGLGTSSSTIHEGVASSAASVPSTTSSSVPSNALSLPDPPAPVRTSPEEQVMSDLLALTISSNPSPPYTPITPEPALNQGGSPVSDHPQPYNVNQGHTTARYVAPWAQPSSQPAGIQQQTPAQSQLPYNSFAYPPPPWASQDNTESNPFVAAASQHQSTCNSPINVPSNLRHLQQSHSFGVPLQSANLESPNNRNLKQPLSAGSSSSESPINRNLKQPLSAGGHKPSYVSSNKFFDDLFERNSDGSLKVGSAVGGGTSSPYKA
uniref:VHS domain-containing protein n=1 Tax=Arundo donax TaxID=35708 RepID=A0A0A9DSY1_ARUDO